MRMMSNISLHFLIIFSILSNIANIFYAAFSEFLGIIEGNITSLMSFTSTQIVFLEESWAYSFHGIWAPAIFIASSGAGMIGVYAVFDMAGTGHVVEEAI